MELACSARERGEGKAYLVGETVNDVLVVVDTLDGCFVKSGLLGCLERSDVP